MQREFVVDFDSSSLSGNYNIMGVAASNETIPESVFTGRTLSLSIWVRRLGASLFGIVYAAKQDRRDETGKGGGINSSVVGFRAIHSCVRALYGATPRPPPRT